MPIGVYDHSKRARLTPEKRAAIFTDWKTEMTNAQIAARYKVSPSTVTRVVSEEKKKKHPAVVPPAVPATELLDAGHRGRRFGGGKYEPLMPKMQALRAEGYSYAEIAKKLGIGNEKSGDRTVAYYLTARFKKMKHQPEGVSTNGHNQLDPRFLVGFGCAELERTLTAIAQRLGVAPNLLRQGFSKFLGSAAFR